MEISNALSIGSGIALFLDKPKTNFLQLRSLIGSASLQGDSVIAIGATAAAARVLTVSGPQVAGDSLVLLNGTLTYTLLTAVGQTGNIVVKNISATLTGTIDGHLTQTIDGAATKALLPGEVVTLMPYSGNWLIVGN